MTYVVVAIDGYRRPAERVGGTGGKTGGLIKTVPFTIQTKPVFEGKGLLGNLVTRLSWHQQVSWPLTVKAAPKQKKTSMLIDTALRNLKIAPPFSKSSASGTSLLRPSELHVVTVASQPSLGHGVGGEDLHHVVHPSIELRYGERLLKVR